MVQIISEELFVFTDESVDSELYGGASNNDAAAPKSLHEHNMTLTVLVHGNEGASVTLRSKQTNENLVQPLNFSGSKGLSPRVGG